MRGIVERIGRSVQHAEAGYDVEHYLDALAGEAFGRLYPQEVDTQSLYARRALLGDHVVDAIVLGVLEQEDEQTEGD